MPKADRLLGTSPAYSLPLLLLLLLLKLLRLLSLSSRQYSRVGKTSIKRLTRVEIDQHSGAEARRAQEISRTSNSVAF